MLLKFTEQTINNFVIPSFTLNKGEIVVIHYLNGALFGSTYVELLNLLIGNVPNKNVQINIPLKHPEHIRENWFRYKFFPITIGEYLCKNANKMHPIYSKIYDIKWMNPKIKVKTLAGTPTRQLSLYATLSWTNNIIFDLKGVDPQGGKDIYEVVKTVVNAGGAAILLDCSDEFKDDCTTFIQVKYVGDKDFRDEKPVFYLKRK
jgi:ABC-type sugar transport system ATPase subunit